MDGPTSAPNTYLVLEIGNDEATTAETAIVFIIQILEDFANEHDAHYVPTWLSSHVTQQWEFDYTEDHFVIGDQLQKRMREKRNIVVNQPDVMWSWSLFCHVFCRC